MKKFLITFILLIIMSFLFGADYYNVYHGATRPNTTNDYVVCDSLKMLSATAFTVTVKNTGKVSRSMNYKINIYYGSWDTYLTLKSGILADDEVASTSYDKQIYGIKIYVESTVDNLDTTYITEIMYRK